MGPTRILGVLALALCAHAGSAASVPFNMQQLAQVRELLPQLDDAELANREAATKTLTESPALSVDALGMALAEPGLTPEQQRRLVTAFKARFAASPRPALGIGMEVLPDDPRGVVVNRLNRGLPAIDAGAIHLGDMIVSINGEPTLAPEDAGRAALRDWNFNTNVISARTIALIQSFDPGDEVTFEILRPVQAVQPPPPPDAKPGEVPIAPIPVEQMRLQQNKDTPRERVVVKALLGRFTQLDGTGNRDPENLITLYGRAAMESRLRRLGVNWPGPSPVNAAAAITPGSENPPPAFTAKQALGLAGGGEAPDLQEQPWANAWNGQAGMEFRGIDAQGRVIMRRGNRLVQMPAGVQAAVLPQRAGMVNPLVAKQRANVPNPAPSPSGSDASGASANNASELQAPAATTAMKRDLRRLADLQSELSSAESRLADPALDPPSQREAQRRVSELRSAVEDLLKVMQAPGFRAEPTVSAEPRDGFDR